MLAAPNIASSRSIASAPRGAGPASYVFNPLSVHWCYRADGSLACLVAEVHNTYGGRHAYLLHPDEVGRAVMRSRPDLVLEIPCDAGHTSADRTADIDTLEDLRRWS